MRVAGLPTPEVVFNHIFINGRLSIFCDVALSFKGNLPLCYVFFLATYSESDSMAFAVKLSPLLFWDGENVFTFSEAIFNWV